MTAHLEVFRTRSRLRKQRWRWRLVSAGRIVAESGEGYANREDCVGMACMVVSGAYRDTAVDSR